MKWLSICIRLAILAAVFAVIQFNTNLVIASGVIRHVISDGGKSGDCTNVDWSAPCQLQYAISIAQPGDEIWVKAGTYHPMTPNDQVTDKRDISFRLKDGVAVYGGFAGNELSRDQRRWSINITTLSGDLLENDSGRTGWDNPTFKDNSYHVVTADGVSNKSILDGFTIRGGNAGSGTFGNEPSGGGISLYRSSPVLRNLIIAGNSSEIANGGGLFVGFDSNPWLVNVLFSGNTAKLQGGAMHVQDGAPIITNVTITGNEAVESGGAISLFYGSLLIRNSIIWNNTDHLGRSIMIMLSDTPPTITYSDIEGEMCPFAALCDETDHFDNPNFINAPGPDTIYGTADDNMRLHENSLLINQGSNITDPALPETDLDGLPRIVHGTVDIGAYEHQFKNTPPISNDQTFYTLRNHSLSGQLKASDADGNQLLFQLSGPPPIGNLTMNSDGCFIYIPAPDFIGKVSFKFTVSDQVAFPVGPYTAIINVQYQNPIFLPSIRR